MNKENEYRMEECKHCGNKTKLDIVARHMDIYRGNFDCDVEWLILKCCSCGGISFMKVYSGEDTQDYDEDGNIYWAEELSTLYPMTTYKNTNVPKKVNNAFIIATKAQHLDGVLCLIALRRTLEIICKDQKAKGRNLKEKIKDLTKKCIFPAIINDASDVLRILGNGAAHGDDFEYDSSIVSEMINFTQIIIEYVYVIPYKIQQIKDTIDEQSN